MKSEIKDFLTHSTIELMVYAGLVFGYFVLVLHWLGHWLDQLFQTDRALYAGVALGLIVGQGVVLELLTSALLWLIRVGRGR